MSDLLSYLIVALPSNKITCFVFNDRVQILVFCLYRISTLLLLKFEKKNFTVHCGMAIGYQDEKNKVNKLKTERENIKNFCKFYS